MQDEQKPAQEDEDDVSRALRLRAAAALREGATMKSFAEQDELFERTTGMHLPPPLP